MASVYYYDNKANLLLARDLKTGEPKRARVFENSWSPYDKLHVHVHHVRFKNLFQNCRP